MTSPLNYHGNRMFPQDILDDLCLRIGALEGGGLAKPIDMLLFCPRCSTQHIDEPEHDDETKAYTRPPTPWTNPPHRSHFCHFCSTIWRPADVCTNGVASIKTVGKADTWYPRKRG